MRRGEATLAWRALSARSSWYLNSCIQLCVLHARSGRSTTCAPLGLHLTPISSCSHLDDERARIADDAHGVLKHPL